MRVAKSARRAGMVTAALMALLLAGLASYQYGSERSEKVVRYARMIDTSHSVGVTKHGSHYSNIRGYFVDKETGLRFGDSIGDSLYRQFEKGGNQPIEVSWPYSVDDREQTSIGFFMMLFGILAVCYSSAMLIRILYMQIFKGVKK